MAWDRMVPINIQTGGLHHYPDKYSYAPGHYGTDFEMRPIWEFEDTLTFFRQERGRSSAIMWMTDNKGVHFPVSLSDFCTFIPHLVDGKVTRKWGFTKRGANYFLAPIGDPSK